MSAETTVRELLGAAGVEVGGNRPQDIAVHDPRFYSRVLRDLELGLGESYMEGWWDAERPDEFIAHLLMADLNLLIRRNPRILWSALRAVVTNQQSLSKSAANAAHHYDIGNDLYSRMLDHNMVYSCAYWKDARTLDEAQEAKLDLICRKLQLEPGMRLLDIGCGWGGFARYAASRYGAVVTAITPAAQQVKLAQEVTAGLSVTVRQRDFREIRGHYDRIVSIGMLEHVGPKNYRTFFDICRTLLADDGIMLHHTIGGTTPGYVSDRWITRYIFPGGVIPSLSQIAKLVERDLVIEDVQNIGPDYDRTLMAWYGNFTARYWEISDRYDKTFYRMWTYYLLACAGAFRARRLQLFQIVMRKARPAAVYIAAR